MNNRIPVKAIRIAWTNESCKNSTIMIIMKNGVVGLAPSNTRQRTNRTIEEMRKAVVVTSSSNSKKRKRMNSF